MKIQFQTRIHKDLPKDVLSPGLDEHTIDAFFEEELERFSEMIRIVGVPVDPPLRLPIQVGIARHFGLNMVIAMEEGRKGEREGVQFEEAITKDQLRLFVYNWFVSRVLDKQCTHVKPAEAGGGEER